MPSWLFWPAPDSCACLLQMLRRTRSGREDCQISSCRAGSQAEYDGGLRFCTKL